MRRFTPSVAGSLCSALFLSTLASANGGDESPNETQARPIPNLWWGDFDGDGFEDALAFDGDGVARLFRNTGDGSFQEVTERVGLASIGGHHMAAWGDANGDGRLDVFLPAWRGESRLLVQTEERTFVDGTEASGLPPWAEPVDASWRDFDADGDLDLHLVTELDDLLYVNDGRGQFSKVDLGLAPRLAVDSLRGAASVEAARAGRGLPPIEGGGPDTNPPGNLDFNAICAIGIQDQANPTACMSASSVPTLGMLYPISVDLFVDAGNGNVGMGTTGPAFPLDVVGTIRSTGDIRADRGVFTSNPPLNVSGSGKVDNLNADFLDGLSAGAFAQLPITSGDVQDGSIGAADLATNSVGVSEIQAGAVGSSEIAAQAVGSSEIVNGSIVDADVAASAAIQGTKISPQFGAQSVTASGLNSGPAVHAVNPTVGGRGTEGFATDPGATQQFGALGFNGGTAGGGVFGGTLGTSGLNYGVWGNTSSSDGFGVYATNASGAFAQLATGFYGVNASGSSAGVNVDVVSLDGIRSRTDDAAGWGLYARNDATTGSARGVYGSTGSASGDAVYASGNLSATGVKNFINPHPLDPTKQIRFVCLEGNESGTYFRGSSMIVGGSAEIEVPEVFRLVTSTEGLTVQMSAVGAPARLWIESKGLDTIVIKSDMDVEFDYFVNGVRRGYEEIDLVQPNVSYLPYELDQPFGTQYPDAYRQILVENGTLNPDFTPNLATHELLKATLEEYCQRFEQMAEERVLEQATGALTTPVPTPNNAGSVQK